MTTILQINLTASVLIIAFVLFRTLALCKFPRKMFLLLWGIVALRLLIPVSVPVYLPDDFGQTPAQVEVSNVPAYGEIVTVPDTPPSVQTAPAPFEFPYEAIWMIGVCAVALFFIISYIRFHKAFKVSQTCENAAVNQWLAALSLRREVQVRQSGEIESPLTYGIFRPIILLPNELDLSDEKKLRFILIHESVHIRRFDAAFKLMLTAAVCLHWFNPLVWIVYVLANRDIELSCDEAVVKQLGLESRSEYAHILIDLVETRSRRAFPLVSYFGKHAEEERITSLMKVKKYSVPVIVAAVAVLLCSGVFAAFALSADSPAEDMILCEDLSEEEAAEIKALFEEESIDEYWMGGSTLYVSNEQYAKSRALVWMLGFEPADYEYDVYYGEDLPLEERDLDYLLTLQDRLEEAIEEFYGVEEAAVVISIGRETGPTVPVTVTMEDENAKLTAEQVTAICKLIQGAVGDITEDKIHITDSQGNLYFLEAQMTPLDGYEEVITDGQINFDNELVSSEITVRTPTETELEVMGQLKNKLNTFSGVEVIAIAAETNDKGKITVDIKLAEGNDLTNEQLRELMDLFYSIVPIEQAGQLGVSAVVREEVIPYGELVSQTYEPNYILPNNPDKVTGEVADNGSGPVYDHIYIYDTATGETHEMYNVTPDDIVKAFPGDRYMVQEEQGVEGNRDIPDYVEGDSSSEVYVPGQSNFDPSAPTWNDNEN